MLAVLLSACLEGPNDEPGRLTGGALTASDEVIVVEEVVRYGLQNARPPCANYGSKEAYCVWIGAEEDPSRQVLTRLADIRPPVLALSECRRKGIVGPQKYTVDPTVGVEWLKVLPDNHLRARVIVSCFASEPTLRRGGSTWVLTGAGWIGCGPVPTDCVAQ